MFKSPKLLINLMVAPLALLIIAAPILTTKSVPQTVNKSPNPALIALQEGLKLYQKGSASAWKQAIIKWQESVKLYEQQNDPSNAAGILINIGKIYSQLGEFKPALETYKKALLLAPKSQDIKIAKHTEATILMSMAQVYYLSGKYQESLDYYYQVLPLWKTVDYQTGIAETFNNIGLVYDDLNDTKQALSYYNKALEIAAKVSNNNGKAAILNNIGRIQSDNQDFVNALNSYNESLKIWQSANDIRGQATTLNNIGFVYTNQGENDQKLFNNALDNYNQALKLWQQVEDINGEASTLNNLGLVAAKQGNFPQALTYYHQALPLRKKAGDKAKEALTLYSIAYALREQGNLTQAVTEIEAAIKIIEELRKNIGNSELRATFFASKQDYYELYIDLLMQLHKTKPKAGFDAEALQVSERARARSLLDVLNETPGEIRRGVDAKLLEKEHTLKQQIDAAEKRRVAIKKGENSDAQVALIDEEIDELLRQYQTAQGQIRSTSPHYANLTQPPILNLPEIQQKIVKKDDLLLSYYLGEKRSYLWAVTSNNINSYELPPRQEIQQLAKQFRDSLTDPKVRTKPKRFGESSLALSQVIIAPVSQLLKLKRLLIIADGTLQYIPFSALVNPINSQPEKWQPLILEHEIINLPSASTVEVLRREISGRKSAPKALAILADPVFALNDQRVSLRLRQNGDNIVASLPANLQTIPLDLIRSAEESSVTFSRLEYTEKEAEQILALFPSPDTKPAIAFAANRATATNPELSQYRMIHFATHGLLNSNNPQLSGLVLSLVDEGGKPQNGFIRLHEIFNLNLPADLVVLSACQTGLGKQVRGEGVIGLTRGFMYAGAARIVVSLWSVDDQATSELMVKFYQGILQKGLSPADALRDAQIQMWQKEQWQSPYYWAAFTLQGEWL